MDREIRELWSRQRSDGIVEGWHGDGNFARTTIMYCLWKTQGVSAHPWREDLRLGAVRMGDGVAVVVMADQPWSGTLVFDRARHAEDLRLPIDWPRINQFAEWFTATAQTRYRVQSRSAGAGRWLAREWPGAQLREGLPVQLEAGKSLRLTVQPIPIDKRSR